MTLWDLFAGEGEAVSRHVVVVGRAHDSDGPTGMHVVACTCGFRQAYWSLADCKAVAGAHWAEYDGGRTQGSNNEREGV